MCVYQYTENDGSGDTLNVTDVRNVDNALCHGPIAEDLLEHQQSYSELPHLLRTIQRMFVEHEGIPLSEGGISVASTSTGLAVFECPSHAILSAKPRDWSQNREPCKFYGTARRSNIAFLLPLSYSMRYRRLPTGGELLVLP